MLIYIHVLASWLLQLRTWIARTKSILKLNSAVLQISIGLKDSSFVYMKLFRVLNFVAGILLHFMYGVLWVNSVGLC